MAVKFLNDIDLNLNELTSFAIQNIDVVGNRPSGVEGQMIFLESSSALQFYDGTGWVTLGDAAAAGTVTSVNLSADSGTGTAITGDGVFAIEGTGVISTSITGRTLTISSSVTNYDDWKLRTDSGAGSEFDVVDGAIVTISGDTGITTRNTNGSVEIDLDDTAVTPGTYTYGTFTVDAQGRLTDADSGTAPSTPSDATITLNTGAGFTAASGDAFTLNQAANETINFVIGAGPGIQVNSTSVQVDYTTTNNIIDSAADGTTLVAGDKFIAEDLTDNIVKEYEIQDILDLVPAGDTYTLPVSAGGANSSVITLDAGTGTDTTVTFNGESNEIALTESVGLDGSITIGLQDNVTITTSLSVPTATVSGSASNALTITGKGRSAATIGTDNDLTLATKGYVDGLVEGGLTFLGTFRADTGEILSGGNDGSFLYNVPGGAGTRVAVAVGDYYVVATAGGNFYANTDYPLDIGDSIIGVETAAADTSVLGDWSLVSQGVTVNSVDTTDGTYINLTPNSATTGAVVVTADLNAVDGTAVSGTRFLSKDNTWDVPAYVSYSAMNTATLGLGRLRYAVGATPAANSQSVTANRTYGVTKNASDQLIVNVPWVDTVGAVLTVNETTPGTSTGTPIVVDPITGNVLVKSMAYAGTTNVGHVPTGGGSTTFLRGDGNWVVPENDQGVETVTASTAGNLDGLSATPTSGDVVVGLDINGLGAVVPVAADAIPLYDASTTANKKTTVANLTTAVQTATSKAYTIASGETTDDLTYPFTLTAGTINDVMIQVVQSSGTESGETVFCDVDRISTTQCRITFGAALTESVRVLVQKIG